MSTSSGQTGGPLAGGSAGGSVDWPDLSAAEVAMLLAHRRALLDAAAALDNRGDPAAGRAAKSAVAHVFAALARRDRRDRAYRLVARGLAGVTPADIMIDVPGRAQRACVLCHVTTERAQLGEVDHHEECPWLVARVLMTARAGMPGSGLGGGG